MNSPRQLVWVETPSNPMMKIVDIAGVAEVVKKHAPDAILAVDNTFMSPYFQVGLGGQAFRRWCLSDIYRRLSSSQSFNHFQNPLTQGADIVVHSITKYINGHSDVVMGCIMTSNEDIHTRLRFLQNGSHSNFFLMLSPAYTACYLRSAIIRSMRTELDPYSSCRRCAFAVRLLLGEQRHQNSRTPNEKAWGECVGSRQVPGETPVRR